MERRLVWIERVWMGGKAALVRGDHWAVRVGEYGIDCYEVQQEKKALSIKSTSEVDRGFLDERGGVGEDGSDVGEFCSDKETQTAQCTANSWNFDSFWGDKQDGRGDTGFHPRLEQKIPKVQSAQHQLSEVCKGPC